MKAAQDLVQIVDAALAVAVRKAGAWLACKPGCTPCCYGPFPITPADVERLRSALAATGVDRALEIRRRARHSVERFEREFPGNTLSRILTEDGAGEDEPCPALDPETGLCDLYEARPITCRTFGPPLHFADESLGVCELCFEGAATEEIAAAAVEIPMPAPDGTVETIVAYALLSDE